MCATASDLGLYWLAIPFYGMLGTTGLIVSWFEPRHEKTRLLGLQPGMTQTGLFSYIG